MNAAGKHIQNNEALEKGTYNDVFICWKLKSVLKVIYKHMYNAKTGNGFIYFDFLLSLYIPRV